MRRPRLRALGWPLVLLALGVASALRGLPRLTLTGSLPACVPASVGEAWLGVNLHILAVSPDCAGGHYAMGSHYVEVARLSVALSLSTILLGCIGLLGALGLGVWVRRAAVLARAWIGRRLVAAATGAPTPALPRLGVFAPRGVGVALAVAGRAHCRRGPPRPGL